MMQRYFLHLSSFFFDMSDNFGRQLEAQIGKEQRRVHQGHILENICISTCISRTQIAEEVPSHSGRTRDSTTIVSSIYLSDLGDLAPPRWTLKCHWRCYRHVACLLFHQVIFLQVFSGRFSIHQALGPPKRTSPLSQTPRRENLFGDTDAQFNSAVQNLPAVKAARERAMLLDLHNKIDIVYRFKLIYSDVMWACVNDFKCAKHSEHIAVLTLLLLLYIPRISKVSYWATGIFVPRRSADDRTTSRNRPCGSASQRPVLEAVETLGTAICSCSGVRCNSQSSNFHLALIQRSCLIKFSASYFFNINEHRAALQIVCWSFAFNSLVFSISPRTAFHASPFCISCGSSYHQGPSRMIQLWFLIAEAKQQRHS